MVGVADGAAAYPITSPTWIIVYTDQTDAAKGNGIKGFLNYIYGNGQKLANSVAVLAESGGKP